MKPDEHSLHPPKQMMDRFLELGLLLQLAKASSYGYELMGRWETYGMGNPKVNMGSLYRQLRKLEQLEWVISSWEESSQGPQRRIYAITAMGRQQLTAWIQVLEERQRTIDIVLQDYHQLHHPEHSPRMR